MTQAIFPVLRVTLRRWLPLLPVLCVFAALAAAPVQAETRRAFLVGNERYSDSNIPQIGRSANDAKDLAGDLEQVGFDKKNIKTVVDLKSKPAFDKEFDAFLKTIEPDDVVFFFYSGHGFGVELEQANYLLMGDVKSPFAFTRAQMTETERKESSLVKLKMASAMDAYQATEIPRAGVSAGEIQRKIAERKPKVAFIILDACRALASDTGLDRKTLKRGPDSGSRLISAKTAPPGFLVLYSASFGEQAVEAFGPLDKRRNGLFTEILRSEMMRPGQTAVELAARVRLVVRAVAQANGEQQEPEFVHGFDHEDDFFLIGSIGRERFELKQDRCEGSEIDIADIKKLPRRNQLERHRSRFDGCKSAEEARRMLESLALGSEETLDLQAPAAPGRRIDPCDVAAASEFDRARPPEVPGVVFDTIDAQTAIPACTQSIAANPRIGRFAFNLARAYHKHYWSLATDDRERPDAFRKARFAYGDAVRAGYLSAFNGLAVLLELGGGPDDAEESIRLLKQAAQQGHPLAMHSLALHYKSGTGIQRDVSQAYEWFAKAAESGFIPAMVEAADALKAGRGVKASPRRAVETFQRAAEGGSVVAMQKLGLTYLDDVPAIGDEDATQADNSLALLWFGRAADRGDSLSRKYTAILMENGKGLPNPQPEIAERYWRLAAYSGDEYAQFNFAEKLKQGAILLKPENGAREGIALLERAIAQGSAPAAGLLAEIYRKGDFGEQRDAVKAMQYAYKAIELATKWEPRSFLDVTMFREFAAGQLLAEMARNNEAVDDGGRALLTKDEIDRIETFYGRVDPVANVVKVRKLSVGFCPNPTSDGWKRPIWVWDWGRKESPTEMQIRYLELMANTRGNRKLRETLAGSFEMARKNKVPFADLIDQQIQSARNSAPSKKAGDDKICE